MSAWADSSRNLPATMLSRGKQDRASETFPPGVRGFRTKVAQGLRIRQRNVPDLFEWGQDSFGCRRARTMKQSACSTTRFPGYLVLEACYAIPSARRLAGVSYRHATQRACRLSSRPTNAAVGTHIRTTRAADHGHLVVLDDEPLEGVPIVGDR